MSKKSAAIVLALVVISLFWNHEVLAQQLDNGSLEGTVTDPNGGVVPNASITVAQIGTGLKRTLTTNAEGRWTARVLPLGNYQVTAEASGFQAVKGTATVTGNETTTLSLVLTIGPVGEIVTVGADGNDAPLTNPEGSTLASAVTGRAIENLPVPNRTSFGLVQRDTSASGDISDPLGASNGNPEVSVNGNRTTSVSVVFNGADITNFSGTGTLTENISPAPETIQEVKLSSSGYDVSIGRTGGGNIQLVTKSGTNDFHGSAYMYVQNEKFNANDFFFNRDGIERQKARRLEGGFTVGGPIIKDKLLFFGGYQKTSAITGYVPTAQSLPTLPEALAFITNRSNPESVRQAFAAGIRRGGADLTVYNSPSCIRDLSAFRTTFGLSALLGNTCIDPTSVGFRLLSLQNPVTGDFFIPTVSGHAEHLFVNPNVHRLTQAQLNALGLPDGIPVIDTRVSTGLNSGLPLVRIRNVVPAEFHQDQFTVRLDHTLIKNVNTLTGTFFFANFPAFEPFSDDTLASPTPLLKNDRNRTLALTDTHVFSDTWFNEGRFGYFTLDNSRTLDERFLQSGLTAPDLGINNPAKVFAPGAPTLRMPRFTGTRNYNNFSVGAPNDIFNRRQQVTYTFADNVTNVRGDHTLRFGVEHKRNSYDTNLPEEQGGEFERFYNWGQFLVSFLPEADTAFGITDKQFRFNDLSLYISDDWRVNERLNLNIGVRWDWFGRPVEKNGRFANFDFSRITDPNNIGPGIILPRNAVETGVAAIDASLPSIARGETDHTLNGQDLNNFAPRFGFAWKPFKSDKTVIRGGYGLFYDRPSAAFINTIYSNYPYLREIESKLVFSPALVPARFAFDEQNPNTPFSSYLPFRIVYDPNISAESPFFLFDNTPGVRVNQGGIIDGRTLQPATGNTAEALEFRAVDRDLKTPMIQQWNLGIQQQLGNDWLIETRYVGSRGQNLLLAVGFNQPYDLNDQNTPDYIFKRLNDVYQASLIHNNGELRSGVSERMRGAGIAYGGCNFAFLPGGLLSNCFDDSRNGVGRPGFDYNVGEVVNRRAIIAAELRTPYLGLDPQDAVILQSRGWSTYHSGQLNVTKRLSRGYGLNFSYTFSKSIDIGSTDPGSTAASGRPDTPNLGLVVQGDQRNINSNKAVSDFDRPHRIAGSFVWELPTFGAKSKFLTGWQLSGFGQWQSGSPFSILVTDANFLPQGTSGPRTFQAQYAGVLLGGASTRRAPNGSVFNLPGLDFFIAAGTGTVFGAAFARPNVKDLELLKRQGADKIREYFNSCQDPTNPACPFLPGLGVFGNLGRNVLRGPSQRRFDFSLQKTTKLSERFTLELKWDVFNAFNFVNFANPNADLSDETDFGQITHTVGAPRVMQFGAKLRF